MQNFLQKVQDHSPGFGVTSGCLLALQGYYDHVGKFLADLSPSLPIFLYSIIEYIISP